MSKEDVLANMNIAKEVVDEMVAAEEKRLIDNINPYFLTEEDVESAKMVLDETGFSVTPAMILITANEIHWNGINYVREVMRTSREVASFVFGDFMESLLK